MYRQELRSKNIFIQRNRWNSISPLSNPFWKYNAYVNIWIYGLHFHNISYQTPWSYIKQQEKLRVFFCNAPRSTNFKFKNLKIDSLLFPVLKSIQLLFCLSLSFLNWKVLMDDPLYISFQPLSLKSQGDYFGNN